MRRRSRRVSGRPAAENIQAGPSASRSVFAEIRELYLAGLANQYRRSSASLEVDLADEATRPVAVPRLRKLIAKIVPTPSSAKRSVDLRVVRHIDEVLGLAQRAVGKSP